MKRILITGVKGFIGTSLKNFIKKNFPRYEIYGIDISLKGSTERFFKRDINDRKFLRNIIREISPHYIFHLVGGRTKAEDFYNLLSRNVFSTYSILDSLLNLRNFKTRLIIPGSAAEYGQVSPKEIPIKESHTLEPVNFYGLSKMYQTFLALSYYRKGLEIVIGRIFNISGWATPYNLSIGNFAYQISLIEKARKKVIIKTKDLDSRRDFLDIQDVCSALVAIAERGKTGNIYNICSARSYRMKDILNYLLRLSNRRKIRIDTSDSPSIGIRNISGSNEKIKKDTRWMPKISISESLKNTLDYYRNNKVL